MRPLPMPLWLEAKARERPKIAVAVAAGGLGTFIAVLVVGTKVGYKLGRTLDRKTSEYLTLSARLGTGSARPRKGDNI